MSRRPPDKTSGLHASLALSLSMQSGSDDGPGQSIT